MRILETALVVSCLPILGMSLLGHRGLKAVAVVLLVAPVVVFAAHAILEGLRAPMIPVYLVAALLGLLGLFWAVSPFPSLPAVRWGALCLLVVLAVGTVFAWERSAFTLPRPPGSYSVGVTGIAFGDGPQNLSARIWYPAKTGAGRRAEYVPQKQKAGLPLHIQAARSHAFEDAGVAETSKPLPVILYSPPWDGRSFQNTVLFEALASAGFVVVALDLPGVEGLPAWDFSTEASLQQFQKGAREQLAARTSQLTAAHAALNDLNSGRLAGGRFESRLDLDAVGAIGYSFGGAVAAEALLREPRLRSGVNLDGILFGDAARSGASQPFLFITDGMPEPTAAALKSPDPAARRNAEFYKEAFGSMHRWLGSRGGILVRFLDADHGSFVDSPLYNDGLREADAQKAAATLQKVNALVEAFFNQTLRNQTGTLVDKDTLPWPEAEMRKYPSAKSP